MTMNESEALANVKGLWGSCGRVKVCENVVCDDELITRYGIGWDASEYGGLIFWWYGDDWDDAFYTYEISGYSTEIIGTFNIPHPCERCDGTGRIDCNASPGGEGIVIGCSDCGGYGILPHLSQLVHNSLPQEQ